MHDHGTTVPLPNDPRDLVGAALTVSAIDRTSQFLSAFADLPALYLSIDGCSGRATIQIPGSLPADVRFPAARRLIAELGQPDAVGPCTYGAEGHFGGTPITVLTDLAGWPPSDGPAANGARVVELAGKYSWFLSGQQGLPELTITIAPHLVTVQVPSALDASVRFPAVARLAERVGRGTEPRLDMGLLLHYGFEAVLFGTRLEVFTSILPRGCAR